MTTAEMATTENPTNTTEENIAFGESDWQEKNRFSGKDSGAKNDYLSKEDWMKWRPGENEFRVITKPYAYWVHKLPELSNDPTKPATIKCSAPQGFLMSQLKNDPRKIPVSEIKCPICRKADTLMPKNLSKNLSQDDVKKLYKNAYAEIKKRGYQPTNRWYLGILDRKESNRSKVADIGPGIFNEIKILNDNSRWGSPVGYDLMLTFQKGKKDVAPKDVYKVAPAGSKEPLSVDDLKMKEEFEAEKLEKMKKMCAPLTEEQVNKKIEFLLNRKEANTQKTEKQAAPEPSNHEGASEGDYHFDEQGDQ